MFQKKTTIVIGAGASNEANLPTGKELKNKISKLLDIKFDHSSQKCGSFEIVKALRDISEENGQSRNISDYIKASWKIRDALPQAISIDNYIDAHQDDKKIEICGKLAIASSILKAERDSKLYIDERNNRNKIDFGNITDTWFNSFLQLITENCRLNNLEQRLSSITLIIFNYDRCVEHFLYHAIQNYYNIGPEQTKELLLKIKIFHPYGSLGDLPWMRTRGIDFGADQDGSILKSIYSEIKTFTESTDPDSSEIKDLRNAVAASEIILFLGFAYHKQNLKLIKPIKTEIDQINLAICFGTCAGISSSDTLKIKSELSDFGNINSNFISLENMKCSQLFYEHWRSLSWD